MGKDEETGVFFFKIRIAGVFIVIE